MEVIDTRFQIATSDPSHAPSLRDLVVGLFTILKHTPIRAVGLNGHAHIKMSSHEAWHRLGDRLAPKDLWNGVLSPTAKRLDRDSTGLRSLTVLGNRPDSTATGLNVTVESSSEITDGIVVITNEHYELPDPSAAHAVRIIADNWRPALDFANAVANRIVMEGERS